MQRYSVTSKRTIVNAAMSAKSIDDALNLAIVENPFVCTSPPSIQVVSYRVRRRSADRIKILAIVAVDADGHPVCVGAMCRIEVGLHTRKRKGKEAYSSLCYKHRTATGTHMPYGITQCYLPPGRGDILAFTPTNEVWYSI